MKTRDDACAPLVWIPDPVGLVNATPLSDASFLVVVPWEARVRAMNTFGLLIFCYDSGGVRHGCQNFFAGPISVFEAICYLGAAFLFVPGTILKKGSHD